MRLLASFTLLAVSSFAATLADTKVVDAVKAGDIGAVKTLIQAKADVNAAEADGTTPLQWAARQAFSKDDSQLADMLIAAHADLKAANRYGVTALYLSCLNGNSYLIGKLLDAGADANATSTEGETALMTASRAGSLESVKVLLSHGAKVDARENWHQQTALMWAVAEKHPEVVKELIAHGADVNARDEVKTWERQTTSEPREKWLPLGGLTPLLFAARQGCLSCIDILIDKGAEPNVVDPDGISGPVLAAINGHYDVAKKLVERGTNPNLADKTGRTVLYSAVDFHSVPQDNRPAPKEDDSTVTTIELINFLLAHGANVNAQLKAQQPYRAKLDRGDDTMLTTGTTALLRAAKAGDAEVVKLLLQHGADPKLATRTGINPLMAAAGLGSKEEDSTGRFKTQAEANETIGLLLTAGVDVNAGESKGQTALHAAAAKGWDQVVKFLAEHGANVNLKDKQGKTPLDAALGNAGGAGGFDGSRKDVHDATATLLRQLMAASAPTAQAAPAK